MRISTTLLVAAAGLSCGSGADSVAPTSLTPARACSGLVLAASASDPARDARGSDSVPASPDLTALRADVSNCTLSLTMTFAAGTLSAADTLWIVALDTDENPQTGSPGRDASATDSARFGSDIIIQQRSEREAEIRGPNPSPAGPVLVPVTYTDNQVRIVVPLELLGDDDGRMLLSVTAQHRMTATQFTGILDYLPDLGMALPRTT